MIPGSPAPELVERSARNVEIASSSRGARGRDRVGERAYLALTWPRARLIFVGAAALAVVLILGLAGYGTPTRSASPTGNRGQATPPGPFRHDLGLVGEARRQAAPYPPPNLPAS